MWHSPDNLLQQEAVGPVVVRGVVVPPELGAGQGEVPELVDEAPHSLLLALQPLIVAVTSLEGEGRKRRRSLSLS